MRWCWTVTLAAALLLPPAACTATACRPMGPCFARVSRYTCTLRLGGGSDGGAETTGAETKDETRAGTGEGDGAEAGAMAPSDVDGGSGPERWVEVESHEVGTVGDVDSNGRPLVSCPHYRLKWFLSNYAQFVRHVGLFRNSDSDSAAAFGSSSNVWVVKLCKKWGFDRRFFVNPANFHHVAVK